METTFEQGDLNKGFRERIQQCKTIEDVIAQLKSEKIIFARGAYRQVEQYLPFFEDKIVLGISGLAKLKPNPSSEVGKKIAFDLAKFPGEFGIRRKMAEILDATDYLS